MERAMAVVPEVDVMSEAVMRPVIPENIPAVLITREEGERLRAPFNAIKMQIRPEGFPYYPVEMYRERLLDVFGPGGWTLVHHQHGLKDDVLYFMGSLFIRGFYVSSAAGEHKLDKKNKALKLTAALEAAKSNCLVRCCKDLGIGADSRDVDRARKFLSEKCTRVFRTSTQKYVYRLKSAAPYYDEKRGQ